MKELTPEQIDQMPAGPEMNALIEAEIFGAIPLTDEEFEIFKAAYLMTQGPHNAQNVARPVKIPPDEREWYTKLDFRLEWPRNYSEPGLASTQILIDKMRADGWLFDICDYVAIARVDGVAKNDKVIKIAGFTKGTIRGEAPAETDALAIGRAALKAKLMEVKP